MMGDLQRDMRLKYEHLLEQINGLSLRERAIMLVLACMLFGGGWYQLYWIPAQKKQAESAVKIADLESQIATLLDAQQQILARKNQDPNKQARQYRDSLVKKIKKRKKTLRKATRNMVTPSEMITVLKSVLDAQSGLTLVSMKALPLVDLEGDSISSDDDDEVVIYRHGFKIEVRGEFLAVFRYFRALEKKPWMVFWEKMDYVVEEHPAALITFEIYTLSLKQELIGT
ncbi:MAG: type II secretion system protein M [Magnetococcales bacterium]|nr:type II secretion system protein M [Magnetococcales bacterium]